MNCKGEKNGKKLFKKTKRCDGRFAFDAVRTKNLLVKYPEDDELEVELFDCRKLIDLKILNNMKWVETCEGWLKEMKKELAKKFSNEELICYCFEKEVFPELVE